MHRLELCSPSALLLRNFHCTGTAKPGLDRWRPNDRLARKRHAFASASGRPAVWVPPAPPGPQMARFASAASLAKGRCTALKRVQQNKTAAKLANAEWWAFV